MVTLFVTQVDGALEEFWRSLRPAGPDLSKGWIAVSFFMRRVSEAQAGKNAAGLER